jgi:hypothetical protein
VLWVRKVSNKRAQLILQLNKSTPLRLRKQKGLDQEVYQWIRLVPSIVDLVALYCDNNGVIT